MVNGPRWLDRRHMPIGVYYTPVLLWLLFNRLRGRRIRYFCLTNPAFSFGGMFGVSKVELASLFRDNDISTPRTKTFAADAAAQMTADDLLEVGAPGIVKPDVAGRSLGVEVFRSRADAEAILKKYATVGQGCVVQEYVTGEEYAVFFVRHPETGALEIIDAVHRERLDVVGDGVSTIAELVRRAGRGIPQKILDALGEEQTRVPADGERVRVGRLGLHSHGCEFMKTDAVFEHPLSEMTERLKAVETLDFFRVDVIVSDQNYYVLEINGALAEPLSAYAPGTTTREFYQRFFDVYSMGMDIGKARHLKGVPLPTRIESLRASERYKNLTRGLA